MLKRSTRCFSGRTQEHPCTTPLSHKAGVLSLNLRKKGWTGNCGTCTGTTACFLQLLSYDFLPFYVFLLKHISLICFPCESRLKNGIRPNGEGGSYPLRVRSISASSLGSCHTGVPTPRMGLNDHRLQISGMQLETTPRNKWAVTAALDTWLSVLMATSRPMVCFPQIDCRGIRWSQNVRLSLPPLLSLANILW